MTSCPSCFNTQILIVLTDRRPANGRCLACGARWLQDGSAQRLVRGPVAELGPPRVPAALTAGGEKETALALDLVESTPGE
ncbi:MAG TPA: hypothetical protein VGB19_15685 [Actinomycetota bacterium]